VDPGAAVQDSCETAALREERKALIRDPRRELVDDDRDRDARLRWGCRRGSGGCGGEEDAG
jgi:hypothetical protein